MILVATHWVLNPNVDKQSSPRPGNAGDIKVSAVKCKLQTVLIVIIRHFVEFDIINPNQS